MKARRKFRQSKGHAIAWGVLLLLLARGFISFRAVNSAVAVYKSWTDNLLALKQLAWTSGLQMNWTNDGKLRNSGVEAHANIVLLNTKNFTWQIGSDIAHHPLDPVGSGDAFQNQVRFIFSIVAILLIKLLQDIEQGLALFAIIGSRFRHQHACRNAILVPDQR